MKQFLTRRSRFGGLAAIVAMGLSSTLAGSAIAAPAPVAPAPAVGAATPAGADLDQYSEADISSDGSSSDGSSSSGSSLDGSSPSGSSSDGSPSDGSLSNGSSPNGSPWGDPSQCTPPTVDQPFLAWNDTNYYTLVPGQDQNGFNGQGWTLANGASVESTTVQSGAIGNVLDLPSGSVAVSPAMCVSSAFPTARTMINNVVGSEGVHVYVAYAGKRSQNNPKSAGQVQGQGPGWTLSNSFNVKPGNSPGWELVRFAFVAGGKSSEFQIDDFYVDPRASW